MTEVEFINFEALVKKELKEKHDILERSKKLAKAHGVMLLDDT